APLLAADGGDHPALRGHGGGRTEGALGGGNYRLTMPARPAGTPFSNSARNWALTKAGASGEYTVKRPPAESQSTSVPSAASSRAKPPPSQRVSVRPGDRTDGSKVPQPLSAATTLNSEKCSTWADIVMVSPTRDALAGTSNHPSPS